MTDPKLGAKVPGADITFRERAGRLEDERVIACMLLWYETVREVHAMGAPEQDIARVEAECLEKIKKPVAAKKKQQKSAPKAATS